MGNGRAEHAELADAAGPPQGGRQGPAAPVRYIGLADWWGRRVWVEHGEVRSGLRYRGGAVIAFAWGRAGLGARELARSILDHATGEAELDEHLYASFVHEVIVRLPTSGFELDRHDVLDWLARQR